MVDQLATLPVGAQLAAALASIDLTSLSGFDCVDVLQAQARQANHERARFLQVVAEVVCRDDPWGTGRTAAPTEFAFDEVRAALVLTRRGADAVCGLAFDLVVRLPAVHAAMLAGVLDEPRARVFCDWTADLSAGHAGAVCEALLPAAPAWTTGQLAEHIKRSAIALDPGWARRRYETAVRGRRLVGTRNRTGRRIWPATTCRSIRWPPPAPASTGWPRPPNTPADRSRSTSCAPTCSSA
jgi:hypothetical protein